IMKRNVASIVIAFFTLIVAFAPVQGYSQALPCPHNIDWETGDTTGWVAFWGGPTPAGVAQGPSNPPPPQVPMTIITTPNVAFFPGRHDIMNVSMGADPYGGFPVVAPTGGQYALKIGSDQSSLRSERVQYLFTVPAGVDNYSINFLYAVVMNDP